MDRLWGFIVRGWLQAAGPLAREKARWHTRRSIRHAALVVATSLFASNANAYRTGADLDKFKGTERVRWSSDTAIFDLAGTLPTGINAYDFSREFVRAFGQWSAPDCGGFQAKFGEMSAAPAKFGDGRNTIEMVSNGWLALGYTEAAAGATDIRYEKDENGQWRIVEADIYINAEYFSWTTDFLPSVDTRTIFSVLLHEGGHALGMLHPCEEDGEGGAPKCKVRGISPSTSVMYPVYDPSQSTLTVDDIAGDCFLYRKCESTGCPDGFECGADGCTLPCSSDATSGHCTVDQICAPTGCVSLAECAETNCLGQGPCTADADCELGDFCAAEGACKTGTRPLGDACKASSQCEHGVCFGDACVPACTTDKQCAIDAICEPASDATTQTDGAPSASPSRGVCVGPQKPFGQPCRESDECLGGECLAGASAAPVCTRLCGDGKAECPAPWTCADVEGRSVCTPIADPKGGCSVAPPIGSATGAVGKTPTWFAWFAAGTVGLLLQARRRRFRPQVRARLAPKIQRTAATGLPE